MLGKALRETKSHSNICKFFYGFPQDMVKNLKHGLFMDGEIWGYWGYSHNKQEFKDQVPLGVVAYTCGSSIEGGSKNKKFKFFLGYIKSSRLV